VKRKRFSIDLGVWVFLCGLVLSVVVCWSGSAAGAGGVQPATGTAPARGVVPVATTTTAATKSTAAAQAAKMRAAGIAHAIAGRFDQSLAVLRGAAELSPDDSITAEAVTLLEDCVSRRRQRQAERAADYAAAVRRVRRAMLAQKYLPKLAKAKLDEKLRKAVSEVIAVYDDAPGSGQVEGASQDNLVELKAAAVKAIDGAAAKLTDAVDLLTDDDSEYANAFRGLAGVARAKLTAYRATWDCPLETPQARRAATEKLKSLQSDLAEALSDLNAMTSAKPWRVAIWQAGLAKRTLPNGHELAGQDWYRRLLADVEARARQAADQNDWYEAIQAYAGLEELEPGNETYRDKSKTVRRHVRVLELYGKKPTEQVDPAADDNGGWRKMTAGVDVEMVRRAINQLGKHYVAPVEYRKIARGALLSVKVLAETSQAANSFPALGDQEKRRDFLKAVDRALDNIESKDRIADDEVIYALNSVVSASERTVEIPTGVLAMEFAEGLLDELDKFSSMVWPDDLRKFNKAVRGHFIGVGIQITKEPGQPLRVVTPLPDTPAYRAGIKPDDVILAVDGVPTEKLSINRLVSMIMGERGTKVVLRINSSGLLKPKDVPIIRDEIRVHTVKGWSREADGRWRYIINQGGKVGYVRLTQFTDDTLAELKEALEQLRQAEVRALVLDLRFNPGGLLPQAVGVADEFLRDGRIVTTRGRNVPETEHKAKSAGGYLPDRGDMVVLVNQYSASAAEIVSGALQDWHRALIVGGRTYGKGSVQNVIPIRVDKAYLKLTTAHYYLPKGRLLHRANGAKKWGVDPDVEVLMTPTQRSRWLEMRQKTDLLREAAPARLKKDLAAQLDADMQLKTAVLLLRLMRLEEAAKAA